LKFWGLHIQNTLVDPMVASFLCDENFPHGLKMTAARELGVKMRKIVEVWDDPYSPEFFEYGADDAWYTLELWQDVFEPRLKEEKMEKPFWVLEMPCVKVAAEMEITGVLFDVPYIEKYIVKAKDQLQEIQGKLYDLAGGEFNLNSPKQIGEIMFGIEEPEEPPPPPPKPKRKLGAVGNRAFNGKKKKPKKKPPPPKKLNKLGLPTAYSSLSKPIGKAGTQYWKTNEAIMQKLALLSMPEAEFPRLILEFRKITKRLSTYCYPYVQLHTQTGDGRVHCSFNTIGAETGRWTCRNPNLQNIPRATKEFSLRHAVIADNGFRIVGADFGQLEMRLMAEISRDPVLMEIYGRDGKCDCAPWKASYAKDPNEPRCRHVDVHTRTAEDAKISRQDAKPLNFGSIYGMGPQTLMAQIFKFNGKVISEPAARRMLDSFFRTYSGVKQYHNWVQNTAVDRGWIKTLLGRKRRLFFVDRGDWRSRGEAFRELCNSSIQGSAADLMMLSMRNIYNERDARAKEDPIWAKCKFISMVHDEILMEAPEEIAEEVREMVEDKMQNCVKLKRTPLSVNAKSGPDWSSVH